MTDKDFFERFVYDSEKDMLGSGGFGTVYKAYDKFEKKYVAIKISQVKDIFGKFTLLNEVELSRKIDHHTNVARYEFGLRVTQPFLIDYAVMDYYEDGNLDHVLKKNQGKLSKEERFDIIEGILEGLKHLHTEGVIHRDIKLANVLMHKTRGGQWRPKIADFGLSRLMDSLDSSVSNSAIGITIAYAAPEQIENHPIKKNVDLWAFGVILYRLMTGVLPFAAAKGADPTSANLEISRKIVMVDLPKEIEVIPQPYKYMIQRCFIKDTHLRVQVADELLDILKGKIKIEPSVVVPEKTEEIKTIIEPTKEPIAAENKPNNLKIQKAIEPETEVKTEIKDAPIIKKEAIKEPSDIPTIIEPPKSKAKEKTPIVEEKPNITPTTSVKSDVKVEKNKEKVVEKIVEKPIIEKDNGKTKKYALRGAALALLLLLGYCGFNKMNTTTQEQTADVQNQPIVEGTSLPVAQNSSVPVATTTTPAKPNATTLPTPTPQTKKVLPTPTNMPNNMPQQTVVSSTTVQQPSSNNNIPIVSPVEQVSSNTPESTKPNSSPPKPPTTLEAPPPVITPPVEKKEDRSSAKIIFINGESDLKKFVLDGLGRECRKILPATITVHNMKIDKNGNIDDSDFFIIIKSSGEVSGKCKSTIKDIITEYKKLKGSVNNEAICEPFTFNI